MTAFSFIKFASATILPVLATWVLYRYQLKNPQTGSKHLAWQLFVGVVYGCIAIYGTEVGINVFGTNVNVRDAAPVTAGLIFGGPAGILAGFIGGIERWIAVYWGAGNFTRSACTGATILAGYYAAFLHEFMFERKHPTWTFGAIIGIVIEVLHLTMILLSNSETPQNAYRVVSVVAGPLIACNSLSIALSLAVVAHMERGEETGRRQRRTTITSAIQRVMLMSIGVALVVTMGIVALVQLNLSSVTTRNLLSLNVDDVVEEIGDASDERLMLYLTSLHSVFPDINDITSEELSQFAEDYITEISAINEKGIIFASTNPEYIGFDMRSGRQSKEFVDLVLEGPLTEYVQEYQPTAYDENVLRKYAAMKVSGGMIQIGLDGSRFQDELREIAQKSAANRHVGSSGFLIITDEQGKVVSTSREMRTSAESVTDLIDQIDEHEPNVVFSYTFSGIPCYCLYDSAEGFDAMALLPASEADFSRNFAMLISAFMEVIVFALLFGAIYFLVKRLVVDGIRRVNGRLEEITHGNLNVAVDVVENEEFASLSDGINTTVVALKNYIADAKARIEQDLEVASDIQQSALPSVFPPYPSHSDFNIYALMRAAKEVGGDFYDFYLIDDDHLVFLVADVSGKSIPGAMFMMRAKTVLKGYVESGLPIDEVFTKANAQLCEGNETSMFVTSWMAIIDLKTGHVQAANAGHNPPAISRGGAPFELLKLKPNLILGCMEGVAYRLHEFDLNPGDVLFLYTDGVVEANNTEAEQYGEERMLKALDDLRGSSTYELCHGLLADVDGFVGDADQFDDITMLALDFVGRLIKEMTLPATLDCVEPITAFVDEELEKIDCPMRLRTQIDVAIDEVLANVCSYAYNIPGGMVTVRYEELPEPHAVRLTFIDSGKPFNPLSVAAPDTTLGIKERKIGGLGIFIVRKTMDKVYYEYRDGNNIFQLTKYLK